MLSWWVKPPRVYLFALAWAALIFFLSATPSKDLPDIGLLHLDKLAHLGVYLILSVLLAYSLHSYGSTVALSIALVLSAVYGLSLEFMQESCFEGRSFDWYDGIANTLGALCGIGIIWQFDRTF